MTDRTLKANSIRKANDLL